MIDFVTTNAFTMVDILVTILWATFLGFALSTVANRK